LLISPIHFAEIQYKNKYHLKFQHARKLFIFDMLLVASSFFLFAFTIFWFTYKPTISDLIFLNIESSLARVASGENIELTFSYKNGSTIGLSSPRIEINLPIGFLVNSSTVTNVDSNSQHLSIPLDYLAPGDEEHITLYGTFFGTPDKDELVRSVIHYQQDKKTTWEQAYAAHIITPRGSVLKPYLVMPDKIIQQGSFPFSFSISNEGQNTVSEIFVPLNANSGFTSKTDSPTIGTVRNSTWFIPILKPHTSTTIQGIIETSLPRSATEATFTLAPHITVSQIDFPQQPASKKVSVVHPQIQITPSWEHGYTTCQPGDIRSLMIELANNGDTSIQNMSLSLPVPEGLIDIPRLTQLNRGSYKQGMFTIHSSDNPSFTELKPKETTTIKIEIPISNNPQGGTDLHLRLSPRLQADVETVPTRYEIVSDSPSLSIGTKLSLSAQARYYTTEGDQLGRGPLPPQVGEETKYWVLVDITNTTSKVENLKLTAQVAPGVKWIRSNVSLGQEARYEKNTGLVTWSLPTLGAHEKAGVYFELSLTPTAEQLGTYPLLIKGIQITGVDSYINSNVTDTNAAIDSSLSTDPIASRKGTIVQ